MIGRITLYSLAAASCALMATGCVSRSIAASPNPDDATRKVELTVYKDDFAMVREQRPVTLDVGQNKVQIANISSKLDPSSVLFTWQSPGSADVVSNTYDLGLPDGRSLLKRYVGQEVDLVHYGQDGKPGERMTGTLELANADSLVLKSKDKYIVDPTGTVIAPNRPDIVAMSQLSIGVDSKSKQSTNLGVAYLTGGLGWSADYVAKLDPTGDTVSLECWATVTNHTGITFPESKITLVAGSPNRTVHQAQDIAESNATLSLHKARTMPSGGAMTDNYAGMPAVMPPARSGELYSYPIQLPATISPEEMNRVRMLSSAQVPVKKDYSIRLEQNGGSYGDGGRPARQNATLTIEFTNSEQSKLGMPLPQGTVRAYEPDAAGAAQYIGAADIRDTPKDQLISLTLSNVFDVTSQSKLVKTRQLDKHHTQQEYSVTLSNAKKAPVVLRVVQGFYDNFVITDESAKSKRLDSRDAQWLITIPPGDHVILKYTVKLGG